MFRQKFVSLIIFSTIISMVLVACAQSTPDTITIEPTEDQPVSEEPTSPATESPTQAPAASSEDKAVTFIFTQEFDNLNPLFSGVWFSQIAQQIWNCWAWNYDEQNIPYPLLVKEIPSLDNGGISQDGRVITMNLRDDIAWSDGTPITSADFVFTYQMAVEPNNMVTSVYPYNLISSINAPDERTVVINFPEPFAPWEATLWHGLLPAHVLKPTYEAEGSLNNAVWNYAPEVGCGPFNFSEWQTGDYAKFVPNENYWQGAPKLDEIVIRFLSDENAQIEQLKTGEADLGTWLTYADVPDLESAGVKIVKAFSGFNEVWYFYLDPTNGHPALQDARVRQAIALAFDRYSLNSDLLQGLTKPATTLWDNTAYNDPALEPWPVDPARAAQLLDEAGWVDSDGDGIRDKDGVQLLLTYGTTTRNLRTDTQNLAQGQLMEIGVKLDPLVFEPIAFFSGFNAGGPAATGQLDIFQYAAKTQFPDPDTSEWLCDEIPSESYPSGTNWSSVCDEELDRLFRLQAQQVNSSERQQTFHQISRLIYEKLYMLGIWQDLDIYGINPRLVNIKISGVTPFYNILEWDIAE